jgi:hypothetical protein
VKLVEGKRLLGLELEFQLKKSIRHQVIRLVQAHRSSAPRCSSSWTSGCEGIEARGVLANVSETLE